MAKRLAQILARLIQPEFSPEFNDFESSSSLNIKVQLKFESGFKPDLTQPKI